MCKDKKSILIDNEPFYYEKVELFYGRHKMDLEIAKENLELFTSIIEKNKITYGIFFGTLLGAIREKNFIKHDEDTDIYLLYEEREKFLRLLIVFKQQGLELVRCEGDMLSLMRKNEYIDLYFFEQKFKFGFIKLRVFTNEYEYAAKNLEYPIKQLFLGMKISMPANPEQVVRKIYGKNWRIPISNKPSEPNTIYKRISKMSVVLKKLPFSDKLEWVVKKLLRRFGF